MITANSWTYVYIIDVAIRKQHNTDKSVLKRLELLLGIPKLHRLALKE